MYRWKETIGDIACRKPLFNIWGYYATHGLGYHEYLQFSEDLGAEPLFCINTGMSHREVVPLDQMGPWSRTPSMPSNTPTAPPTPSGVASAPKTATRAVRNEIPRDRQ